MADNEYELTDAVADKFGYALEAAFNGDFSVFESVVAKRKGCCSPKRRLNEKLIKRLNHKYDAEIDAAFESRKSRKNNLISLTEALKAFDEKDQKKLDKSKASIEDILKMVKGQSIGEREAREAFQKLKREQNAIKKIKKNDKENFSVLDVPGVTKAIKAMIAADPDKAEEIKKFRSSLTESVINGLVNKKKSIHENLSVNGRKMNTISYKDLAALYESMKAKKAKLTEALKKADMSTKKGQEIKENLSKQVKAMNVVAEELSYRRIAANVFARLNEADEAEGSEENKPAADEPSMDDLAAMFGSSEAPADDSADDSTEGEGDDTEAKDDETEEVELARVVIEMATKEDAEQLRDLCKEAGIPEEAMEIQEGEEDDSDTSDIEEPAEEEESDDDAADTEDESEEEEKSDEKNESVHYKALRRLFEADGEEDAANDEDSDDAEGESEETDDADESEEATEDATIKFVLTDTDYVDTLGQVLNDEYGISEEEFEGMIGGEVVEADDEDESDSEDAEPKEDEAGKDDESDEDEIDAADIFGNM